MSPLAQVIVKLLMLACSSALATRDDGGNGNGIGAGAADGIDSAETTVGPRYGFGYHPSAEEFDHLRIGDRVRTWTRDLLAQQRRQQHKHQQQHASAGAVRRSWAIGEFVPKFSYERQRQRHTDMAAWHQQQPHYQQTSPTTTKTKYFPHNHSNDNNNHAALDQLPAAGHAMPVIFSNAGGDPLHSSLEFNMFSDEVLTNSPTAIGDRPAMYAGAYKPLPAANQPQQQQQAAMPHLSVPLRPPAQNGVTIIEIASSEINSIADNNNNNHNHINQHYQHQPISNTGRRNSSLPIYFTNPATGVVYAITEIGRVQGNASANYDGGGLTSNPGSASHLGALANGSIPIYITKQQYDRDVQQLHAYYQQQQHAHNCAPSVMSSDGVHQNDPVERPSQTPDVKPPSSFSSAPQRRNTTVRPQIIRLSTPRPSTRPASGISKLPTFELAVVAHKPKLTGATRKTTAKPTKATTAAKVPTQTLKKKPVAEIGVGGQLTKASGVRQQTKRKRKRKNKKTKLVAIGAFRPPTVASGVGGPHIVRGTRTKPMTGQVQPDGAVPSVSSVKLHTQLEKPSVSAATVFSQAPMVVKRGFMQADETAPAAGNHRVRRAAPQPAVVAALVAGAGSRGNGTKAARRVSKTPKTRKTQRRKAMPNTRRLPQSKGEEKRPVGDAINRWHNALTFAHIAGALPSNRSDTKAADSVEAESGTTKGASKARDTTKRRKKLKDKAKAGGDAKDDDGDDLIDLLDELTGHSGESESKHADDSYYDDEDEDEDEDDDETQVPMDNFKEPKRKSTSDSDDSDSSGSDGDGDGDGNGDDAISDSDALHEDIAQSNSSSAEENADFGALEEDMRPAGEGIDSDDDDDVDIIWTTSTKKNTALASAGKKRIRRRPPPPSNKGDYDDDYEDDDDGGGVGGGGVSGFFRMLFYPVQAMMSRLFAVDDDDNSGEDVGVVNAASQYPTYTLYHNGLPNAPNAISAESNDDDQSGGGGITEWLSSWFGFNRRTKNIGSTTKAPPIAIAAPQTPPPTKRPISWLESWLGFGFGGTSSDESETSTNDDYDKWFSSWFDTKPKARRRTTTTTPSAPLSLPQVPILTIVDPLKNPQNWIGILAHHLANATATTTTTHNPLMEAITRATTMTTSTVDPDVPRRITYDKYQIWRLKPQDDSHVRVLDEYKRSDEGNKLQWLKGPSLRGLTDVLVPPKVLNDFRTTLTFEGIAYEVLIFDVGKAIAYEKSKEAFYLNSVKVNRTHQQQVKSMGSLMSWHKYYEYDAIIKYVEWLRLKHPQIVELMHIGRSYEGRPLVIVKLELQRQTTNAANANAAGGGVGAGGGGGGVGVGGVVHKKLKHRKKSGHANAVFIEAGTHGLEWIGPASATWIINEVLRIMRNNKTSEDYDFIRKTAWYIMPVLNPDGYVYTHENDRFWRKTRSRHVSEANGLIDSAMNWLQQKRLQEKICYGVDLDRNWAYHWGRRGSSTAACNEFYAGPMPFSEPETKALSEFLMEKRKRIKLFISLQAYGQVISFPIRANASFTSERMEDLLDVAMVGTDGLRKKNSKSRYKVDTTSDLIEHRSGCSDAFAAYEVSVPFSFTLQLADNGVHGYLLPGSSIESTARDTFDIITSMLDYI